MKIQHYLSALLTVLLLGASPARADVISDYDLIFTFDSAMFDGTTFSGPTPVASGMVFFDPTADADDDDNSIAWMVTIGTEEFSGDDFGFGDSDEFLGSFNLAGLMTTLGCENDPCEFIKLAGTLAFPDVDDIDTATFAFLNPSLPNDFQGNPIITVTYDLTFSPKTVPEPVTVALIGLGLLGFGYKNQATGRARYKAAPRVTTDCLPKLTGDSCTN